MGDDDEDTHASGGCPGMWRLVEAVLDRDRGAVTVYICDLCETVLIVPPGGIHPGTA